MTYQDKKRLTHQTPESLFKRHCISLQGEEALRFIHSGQKLSSSRMLSILSPRNAMKYMFCHSAISPKDKQKINFDHRATATMEALSEVWVKWDKRVDAKEPGLLKRFIQSETTSFWAHAILGQDHLMTKLSLESQQKILGIIIKHDPRALIRNVPHTRAYLDLNESFDEILRQQRAWKRAYFAPKELSRFWAPVAAKDNNPNDIHDFLRSTNRKHYHTSIALIEALEREYERKGDRHLENEWNHLFEGKKREPQELMMVWANGIPVFNSIDPHGNEYSRHNYKVVQNWIKLGELLWNASSKNTSEALNITQTVLKNLICRRFQGINVRGCVPEAVTVGEALAKIGLPIPSELEIREKLGGRELTNWEKSQNQSGNCLPALYAAYEAEILKQQTMIQVPSAASTAQPDADDMNDMKKSRSL